MYSPSARVSRAMSRARRDGRLVHADRRSRSPRRCRDVRSGANALRCASVGFGQRLTGWVAAAARQPIVSSPANLDFAARTEIVPPLQTCMSIPLMSGDALVAVLSVYSPRVDAFDDDCGRMMQTVAPHLAAAIHATLTSSAGADSRAGGKRASAAALRLVATRWTRAIFSGPGSEEKTKGEVEPGPVPQTIRYTRAASQSARSSADRAPAS